MNLLLRIIDQSVDGIETSNTIPLGEKGYYSLMNTDRNSQDSTNKQAWQNALDGYYNDNPCVVIDGKIVGFIYFENRSIALLSNNVYYIVSQEGKTIERIYGQYVKY